MAYTPKRNYRKRSTRRSRTYRKRTPKRNALSVVTRSQLFATNRFVNKLNLSGSDTTPAQGQVATFILTDVPNHTEFTALFDQYKIAGIAYRFVVNTDPMLATTKRFPCLKWVIDVDDSTVPANALVLQQYPRMKEFWFTESRQATRWFYFKPARAALEDEIGGLTATRVQYKGFIDCGSTQAPHYGIKTYIESLYAGVSVFMQCRYYMVFKNHR